MKFKLVMVLVVTFIFISCTNKENDSQSSIITIGSIPSISSMPIFYADDNDIFKNNGVDVTVEKFFSAKDRDIAYIGNQINAVTADLIGILTFYKADIPTTTVTSSMENFGLVLSPNSSYDTIDDLVGSDILYSKNSIIEYTIDKIFEHNNLPIESINKISIPAIPLRVEMLAKGDADSAVLPEPFLSMAKLNGGKVLTTSSELGINLVSVAFKKDFLDANNEAINKFLLAYNESVNALNNLSDEQFENYMFESYGFSEDLRGHLDRFNFNLVTPIDYNQINSAIEWSINAGILYTAPTYNDLVRSEK